MGSRDLIIAEIPRLRRYARALTGSMDAADDLVQETLERALEKWLFWKRERDLRPWLFSIMHNLHIDHLRKAKHIDYFPQDELPEVLYRPDQLDGLEIRDLDRALAQLPIDQRQVLLLITLEGLSYKEVAKTLRIPVGSVMSRLSRARTRLRALLEEDAAPLLRVVKS
ncbi:RNA polymerase sigma factor [Pusillimonas sp. 7-48]|uniref:RNA polymerase sigma factor n=1 Tax=Pusillimonas minor TaxID=2697024 RepID=A0A842HI96_9BURK|nr:RNA polymerase sigma factor [Pusillimonas minor]